MDTRNLLHKGNRWYLNFTFPRKFGVADLSGRKVRISLDTADYKVARGIRDSYISGLVAANDRLQLVERLARMITDADDELRRLVEAKLPSLKIKSLAGTVRAGGGMTLRELVGRYLKHLADNTDLKVSTQRRYKSALDCFTFVIGGGVAADSLKHDDIVNFVSVARKLPVGYHYQDEDAYSLIAKAEKTGGKRLSVSNIAFVLTTVGSFFKWAVNDDKLPSSPMKTLSVYIGDVKQKHKVKPDADEADKLCSMPCKKFSAFEWKYAPLVARYTGMRIGEIAQMQSDWIVEKHGVKCIAVRGDLKTETSERLIPIADKLLPYINEILRQRKAGRLFDLKDFEKDGLVKYGHDFLKKYNRAAKKVGDFSFHCWRVYANSEMLDGGVAQTDCERILGHKTQSVNAAYTNVDIGRLKRAVDRVF